MESTMIFREIPTIFQFAARYVAAAVNFEFSYYRLVDLLRGTSCELCLLDRRFALLLSGRYHLLRRNVFLPKHPNLKIQAALE